jgi:hypothetical protein
MDTYRKTHNDFFLSCAYLRHAFGLSVVSLADIDRWLSDQEISDFTCAYMAWDGI